MSSLDQVIATKCAALGYTGSTHEQMIKLFKANGATSDNLNEAYIQFAAARGVSVTGRTMGEILNSLASAYSGTLQERLIQYWTNLTLSLPAAVPVSFDLPSGADYFRWTGAVNTISPSGGVDRFCGVLKLTAPPNGAGGCLFQLSDAVNYYFEFRRIAANNSFRIEGYTAGGVSIFSAITAANAILQADGPRFLFFDGVVGGNVSYYVGDVLNGVPGTWASGNLATDDADGGTFFADFDGSGAMTFSASLFWVSFGSRLDFSVEANRRLFMNAGGSDAEIPTNGVVGGITPQFYFGGSGSTATTWNTSPHHRGGITAVMSQAGTVT